MSNRFRLLKGTAESVDPLLVLTYPMTCDVRVSMSTVSMLISLIANHWVCAIFFLHLECIAFVVDFLTIQLLLFGTLTGMFPPHQSKVAPPITVAATLLFLTIND